MAGLAVVVVCVNTTISGSFESCISCIKFYKIVLCTWFFWKFLILYSWWVLLLLFMTFFLSLGDPMWNWKLTLTLIKPFESCISCIKFYKIVLCTWFFWKFLILFSWWVLLLLFMTFFLSLGDPMWNWKLTLTLIKRCSYQRWNVKLDVWWIPCGTNFGFSKKKETSFI